MRYAVIAVCLALSACATPYQEATGWNGGLGTSATRLGETRFIITVVVTPQTPEATLVQFALRRAAEETVKAGYDRFTIIASGDASRSGTVIMPGSSTTTASVVGIGNGAYGTANSTYRPAQVINTFTPGAQMTIELSKGPAPDQLPHGTYDARDTLRFTEPAKK